MQEPEKIKKNINLIRIFIFGIETHDGRANLICQIMTHFESNDMICQFQSNSYWFEYKM